MDQSNQQNLNINEPIVWVDLEMSGLDVDKNQILEIAVIITDGNLEQLYEGPNLIISSNKEHLDQMDEWCTQHHTESGLVQQCIDSKINLMQADEIILNFVKSFNIKQSQAVLAGNSVHEDRRFLIKQMPNFTKYLHYRIIDVSTIKELCRRWHPQIYKNQPQKKNAHRALDDIKESIKELKFYRNNLFVKKDEFQNIEQNQW